MNRPSAILIAASGWVLLALALFAPVRAGNGDSNGKSGGPPPSDGGIASPNCPADIAPGTGDGVVGIADLLAVIGAWGPCPGGCLTAAECDDFNDCTFDACVAGQCVHTPIPGCCNTAADCQIYPNAQGICVAQQCVMGPCDPGYFDCNGLPSDGCEVNVLSSNVNCGGCNIVCSIPNANTACINGQCVFMGCLPGYADCNMTLIDGCEVDIITDPNNCGGCNNVCTGNCVQAICVQ